MELFGTGFTILLGAVRLRFVLMLEDAADAAEPPPPARPAHHLAVVRNGRSRVR